MHWQRNTNIKCCASVRNEECCRNGKKLVGAAAKASAARVARQSLLGPRPPPAALVVPPEPEVSPPLLQPFTVSDQLGDLQQRLGLLSSCDITSSCPLSDQRQSKGTWKKGERSCLVVQVMGMAERIPLAAPASTETSDLGCALGFDPQTLIAGVTARRLFRMRISAKVDLSSSHELARAYPLNEP